MAFMFEEVWTCVEFLLHFIRIFFLESHLLNMLNISIYINYHNHLQDYKRLNAFSRSFKY